MKSDSRPHVHNPKRLPAARTFGATLIMLVLCGRAAAEPVSSAASRPATSSRPVNPFFAFENAFANKPDLTPEQRAQMLSHLGYDGMSYSGLKGLSETLAALERHHLRLFVVYLPFDIDSDVSPFDSAFKAALHLLKGHGTMIWPYFPTKKHKPSSTTGDERAVAILRELANLARENGLKVAIYPHTWFYVQSSADALRLVQKANRPNLGITFNLAHQLKLGRVHSLEKDLRQAAPHLFVVTVNGADADAQDWNRLIQPLGMGSFDTCPLLRTLAELKFTGPVGLQCYAVPGDPRENLARSMKAWRACIATLPSHKEDK